ncbi:MAG: DUF433 domain-containing protein [Geminicoccaceae bacterium]
MGGRACIRGMPITVATIVGQIAGGASNEEILADYPVLEPEDIRQVLAYAAYLAREQVVSAWASMRFLVDMGPAVRVAEWLRDEAGKSPRRGRSGRPTRRDCPGRGDASPREASTDRVSALSRGDGPDPGRSGGYGLVSLISIRRLRR